MIVTKRYKLIKLRHWNSNVLKNSKEIKLLIDRLAWIKTNLKVNRSIR